MKNVLIISPEAWDEHTVSKHHYAMSLAKMGTRVYFLNPPGQTENAFEIKPVDCFAGLYTVSAKKVASGMRFLPSIVRRLIEKKWLAEFERAANVSLDVIWLFENSRFFDMRFAGSRLKIYHQVDLNQDFNPDVAAKTADICFCTTDLIRQRIRIFNKRAYKIHHGHAGQHNQGNLTSEQSKLLKKDAIIAVYIGNLDMAYLDAELLYRLVRTYEAVHFQFLGGHTPEGQLWQLCSDLPNITWWGKVESSLIPPILSAADIQIVTYREDRWRDQANPHKFMEYLASGKIIVATYTDEYSNQRHLLKMVDSSEEYIDAFGEVVGNIDKYNSCERMESRIAFAMDNTYVKQLQRINNFLATNNFPLLI